MPIIGNVEKRSLKVKILNISIHLILLIGATTMIYPLLIMISGSLKSDVDFAKFSVVPEFIWDAELLFKKHLLTKFNNRNDMIFAKFREPMTAVVNIEPPENPNRARYDDYKDFLSALKEKTPHYWRGMGMATETGVEPLVVRNFREWLIKKYGGTPEGLKKLNAQCGTDYAAWNLITLPQENFLHRKLSTDYSTGILKEIAEFKKTLSGLETFWFDVDGAFTEQIRKMVSRDLDSVNTKFGSNYIKWSDISIPVTYPADANKEFIAAWVDYIRGGLNLAFEYVYPAAAPHWTKYLRKRYPDIASLNKAYGTKYKTHQEVKMPLSEPAGGQLKVDWSDFMTNAVPPQMIHIKTLANEYRAWLKHKYATLDKVNDTYEMGVKKFEDIPLPAEYPKNNLVIAKDWAEFVDTLPADNVGLIRTSIQDYRAFIEKQYAVDKAKTVDFARMSKEYNKKIKSKLEIPFFQSYPNPPETGIAQSHYTTFIKDPENSNLRVVRDIVKSKTRWIKFLKEKYNDSVSALNSAWGMTYTSWDKIAPPSKEYEWFNVLDHREMLVKEYLKRNYVMVIDTIITNGDAAKNTVIYCFLAILAALLVNPLCAYALSRYKMAPAYKILLFLMLPMAFPAMVLGIPQFLLIKNLGLLNTFAALILPGMANGYMIFLLKGFFDSLPKELFESAAIDGASEWVVFWHIAMGLSTPILSVLALQTFTAAYGNFMMAFLLCQDQKMWTMMVYLYQLQQRTSQAVGFAALIIAAVPTLLVFIFCQNIIIKGIVVPTEK